MDIAEAQRDVRRTFPGGFAGQLVSAVLWLGSAALATRGTPRRAILFLMRYLPFPFLAGVAGRLLVAREQAPASAGTSGIGRP
jgi:hypothetical protein